MKILKTTIAALLFSASVFAQEATLTVTTEGTGFRVKPAVTAASGQTVSSYKIIISHDGDFVSADGYTVISDDAGLLTLKTVSWWSPTSYTSIVFNNTTTEPVINGVYATLSTGAEIFIGDTDPNGNGTNVISIPGEFWLKNGSRLILDQTEITGNVGVGTNDPEEKLHVEGNVLSNQFLLTKTSGIAGSANGKKTSTGHLNISTGGGVVSPRLDLELDGGEKMSLFSHGLGIGNFNEVDEKLQVQGNIKSEGLKLTHTSSILGGGSSTVNGSLDINNGGGVVAPRMTLMYNTYDESSIKLFSSGVGIGTFNGVSEKLEVAGNIKSEGLKLTHTSSTQGGGSSTVNGSLSVNNGSGVVAPRLTLDFKDNTNSQVQLFTTGVSVGNITNMPSGYSFAVDGKVICEELKVQLSQDWPDYVFADNYELMPLDSLQEFVNDNNHLPNIPNAKDMKANGVSVSEMNVKLMEKVEELTLYILKMNQEIEALKIEQKKN
jgi:hypothetical protein